LYLLVVLVYVVRWVRSGAVDVWRRGLLICVRDNSRVVGWLRLCHPVSGGLRFWAVSGRVGVVFAMEQAVKSARLLRASPAPTTSSVPAALWGILLAARGLTSRVLVGDVVHLLLIAAVPTGVWLRKASSTCGWTVGCLWVSSETRLCAGGALRIWHIFQIADTTPRGSWADP
jgi:hypothetical protein